jgi:oligopeptide transport system permease protein
MSERAGSETPQRAPTRPVGLVRAWFRSNRLAGIVAVLFGLAAIVCFGGPLLLPSEAESLDFDNMNAPINLFSRHPLGTDEFGRDLLVRMLVDGQTWIIVGLILAVPFVIISAIDQSRNRRPPSRGER